MTDKERIEQRQKTFAKYGFDKLYIEPGDLPNPIPDGSKLSPADSKWKSFFTTVEVKDMEHLKLMVGLTSEEAARASSTMELSEYADIYETSKHAIFGDWQGQLSSKNNASEIEEFVLSRAKSIPVFAGKDLVVKDGEKVTLGDAPTYYFDNVYVYGSGEIVLDGQIKMVVSGVVEYIPN